MSSMSRPDAAAEYVRVYFDARNHVEAIETALISADDRGDAAYVRWLQGRLAKLRGDVQTREAVTE